MSFLPRLTRRRRGTASVAVVTVAGLVLTTLAVVYDGVTTTDVDLNDGGVWVTNSKSLLVGRLNHPSQTLDSALYTRDGDIDLQQEAGTVLVHDRAADTAGLVDIVGVALGDPVVLPADADVAMGGGTVAILDSAAGALWVTTTAALSSLTPASTPPTLEAGPGSAVAVGSDGAVHLADTATRSVLTLGTDGTRSTIALDDAVEAPDYAVTAVGSTPVVLERSTGALSAGSGATIGVVADPASARLQEPGPDSAAVAYSRADALVEQPLGGGAPVETAAGASGTAVAPVVVGGCAYAAWTGAGRYVRDCAGTGDDVQRDVEKIRGDKRAAFRVNRTAVVLNELDEGTVWLVNQEMREVANWQDVTPPPDEAQDKENKDSSKDQLQNTLAERPEENRPPITADDSFGVRAGRTILLPVLDNDSDPDGDVLTASVAGDAPPLGRIVPVLGGSALQISVDPGATGSGTFRYAAADGRGGTAEAGVTLTVRSPEQNEPPEQKRSGAALVVEQGATASYTVLPDWIDPDGDDLFLTGARSEDGLQVEYRPDGLVTVTATGEPGRATVRVTVSDGARTTDGTLLVSVVAPGTAGPVANADHATAEAGRTATVSPLENDVSPGGRALTLSAVEETAGVTLATDYSTGTFEAAAADPGTYYLQYTVSDGPQTAVGLVRLDVLPAATEPLGPVAVRDVALLPAAGDVLVDPLQNDTDPNGGLLVIQSIDVSEAPGISVAVLDHAVLRVTDQPGIVAPVSFEYTVSNGYGSETATVVVVPVPGPATLDPPVANDDAAVVRAGDSVTVDVLANDVSPSGSALRVVPQLAEPLVAPEDGSPFVSEDDLRFLAGPTPGTVYVTYEIVDDAGQKDAGYVTIQILPVDEQSNLAPRPLGIDTRALAGSTVRIPVVLDGIDPDGDTVTLVGPDSSPAPAKGRIVEIGQDYLSYEAFPDARGTDLFGYRVRDAFGAEATASIRVGIAGAATTNQAPNALQDSITVQPGRTVAVDVLGNDTDPDGGELDLVEDGLVVPDGVVAGVASGRVVVDAPTSEGQVSIQYTVADELGATAVGSLLVTTSAEAVLEAPIARDDVVRGSDIAEGSTSVSVAVLDNDDDPDGRVADLSVTIEGDAEVSGDGVVTAALAETPRVLLYTITDQDGLQGRAFVRVPGTGDLGPAMRPGAPPVVVKAGEEVRIALGDHVYSPVGKSVRVTQADRVSATHAASGDHVVDEVTLRYTSLPDYFGEDALTVEVTDGTGPDDPAGNKTVVTIPITVTPQANQPPTFAGGSVTTAPGEGAATLELRALSADPDPGDLDRLEYELIEVPAGLTASVSGSVLSVEADETTPKGTTAALPITISDGTNAPVQSSVDVEVTASTRPLVVTNDDTVPAAAQGRPVTVDVLSNDTNPFPETSLTLLPDPAVETGDGEASSSGSSVVVTPAPDFVGSLVVRYQVEDATGDPDRRVYGTIRVTVQGAPAAPGAPLVSSVQDRTVVLSWAPGSSNGAEITGYTAKWSGGSQACPTTTCTISGLTNDVEYVFTVTATNEVGESEPSPASAPARPDARPSAPSITALDYGDRSIDVSWSDGANPGSAVTEYIVEVTGGPGARQERVAAPAGRFTVTGLANGENYGIRVQAKNKAPEPSDWSAAREMSPAGQPGAPAAPSVGVASPIGAQAQIVVTWAPPAVVNAEGITGSLLQVKSGGSVIDTITVEGEQTSQNVSVDFSEAGYTFAVATRNKAVDAKKADPLYSADSAPRRAVQNPGAPTITSATESDNAITQFAWTAGAGNGLSTAETSFVYDLNGDGVERPAGSTLTDGIRNNEKYTVRLRAVATVDGNPYASEWSTPLVGLRPYGTPFAPRASASGSYKSVSFDWSDSGPNGRDITQIEVTIDGVGTQIYGAGANARRLDVGFSDNRTATVVAIDEAGNRSAPARAGAASWAAPATQARQGGQYVGPVTVGTCDGDPARGCWYLDVSGQRFQPNSTVRVLCRLGGDTHVSGWVAASTDGSGGFFTSPCRMGRDSNNTWSGPYWAQVQDADGTGYETNKDVVW